jgi:hypothetical protein
MKVFLIAEVFPLRRLNSMVERLKLPCRVTRKENRWQVETCALVGL